MTARCQRPRDCNCNSPKFSNLINAFWQNGWLSINLVCNSSSIPHYSSLKNCIIKNHYISKFLAKFEQKIKNSYSQDFELKEHIYNKYILAVAKFGDFKKKTQTYSRMNTKKPWTLDRQFHRWLKSRNQPWLALTDSVTTQEVFSKGFD